MIGKISKHRAAALAALTLAMTIGAASSVGAEPRDGGAVMAGAPSGAIKSIVLAPDDGALGAALANEFRRRGYAVADGKNAMTSDELAALKTSGVDAVLFVRTAGGSDAQPQAAAAQINSTTTGAVLAKITWQNGWSGWRGAKGSPAGAAAHKNLSQAAREIADDLINTLS